jgi:hypothetical protein
LKPIVDKIDRLAGRRLPEIVGISEKLFATLLRQSNVGPAKELELQAFNEAFAPALVVFLQAPSN